MLNTLQATLDTAGLTLKCTLFTLQFILHATNFKQLNANNKRVDTSSGSTDQNFEEQCESGQINVSKAIQ